jgi:hypothetical protein
MLASSSYEEFCDLTDGLSDRTSEADLFAEQQDFLSLCATEPMGGEMRGEVLDVADLDRQYLGDGDGNDAPPEEFDDPAVEEVEDRLSNLDVATRAVVAGNALSSVSDDYAAISVLEWLCRASPDACATVAKQATELLVNRLAAAQRAGAANDVCESSAHLTELLSVVSPSAFGAVLGVE